MKIISWDYADPKIVNQYYSIEELPYLKNSEEILTSLRTFSLYDMEIYNLFYSYPKNTLDLSLIIEDIEERFTEEEMERMINVFSKNYNKN